MSALFSSPGRRRRIDKVRKSLSNENDTYRADALVRKGVRIAARGKLTDAMLCLEEAVSCAPDHPFGHLHLSLAMAREGRVDEARTHLDRALELQPKNAAFRLFSGRIHFDVGDYRAAAREFARGMEINPENDLLSAYKVLNDWAAGDGDAPKRFAPDNLPDSTAFLARLLMLVEVELKGRGCRVLRGTGTGSACGPCAHRILVVAGGVGAQARTVF